MNLAQLKHLQTMMAVYAAREEAWARTREVHWGHAPKVTQAALARETGVSPSTIKLMKRLLLDLEADGWSREKLAATPWDRLKGIATRRYRPA
jgi:DNA-binding MurR/RpiR family transcriptional regulator